MEEDTGKRSNGVLKRLEEHAGRLGYLERQVAVLSAMQTTMQDGIKEARQAAIQAAQAVDSLKMWLLATSALVAANLLYLILRG